MTLRPARRSRVVIAGCGYVGTALAERLARGGDEVVGIRRSEGSSLEAPGGGTVRFVAAPFAHTEALTAACEGADYAVFSAAADETTDDAYRQTYALGLRAFVTALLAARAPLRRLVFTSSTGVYGQSAGERVDETSPTTPTGFTGQRMLEAEGVLADAPFSSVSLRLGGIYGPGRARMIDSVRRGEARLSSGGGLVTNRIHRDDAARAVHLLLRLSVVQRVYLGVDSEPASRDDVVRFIAERLGLPEPPVDPGSPARARGGEKRCDNQRLLAAGLVLRYPSYREGYGALLAERP
jgi:nucleoside-diphosphate-sugar epimerase